MQATIVGSKLRLAQPTKATAGAGRRTLRARHQAPPTQAFFSRGGPGGAAQQPGGDNSNSAAPSNSAQDTMVSDGAIKSLSPEARRIFREAQDNIIELNKSRLRALEELKAARQKIAELESKLESAVAEASSASAQLQQLGPASSQRAAAAAAAAAPPATLTFQQQPQQPQQPPQQQFQQQPASDAGPTITVVYETGWSSAFLHHSADGRGWTQVPGTKMDNGNQQFPDKKVITVPGRRLEFVINDGDSDWDKPVSGGKGGNYAVEEPGVYRLRNGKLTKLA